MRTSSHSSLALPALLLFVSGAVALVYEVAWQRQFALVLGSGAPATAAVLAAYFAGLGTGSVVMGRFSARRGQPLLWYAAMEAAVAGGALSVDPLLSILSSVYPTLYSHVSDAPAVFLLLRLAACGVILFIPSFCMGATLPLLSAWIDRRTTGLGQGAGWLYVMNTIGAGLGALALPFVLLPQLGLSASVGWCAGINLALGGIALLAHRAGNTGTLPAPTAGRASAVRAPAPEAPPQPVRSFAALSGFSTFALQVLWNRGMSQVHENSAYAFAVATAVIIFALAAGAQIARLLLRRGYRPVSLLSGAWAAGGVLVATGPTLLAALTHGLEYLPHGGGWGGQVRPLVLLLLAVVAPPALALGAVFPATLEQAGRQSAASPGAIVGTLLGWNIAGAVAGALAAGFLLPSLFPLWSTLHGLGIGLLAVGAWLCFRAKMGWPLLLAGAAGSAAGLLWGPDLPRTQLATQSGERLIALSEGPHGITAVVERPGSRRLKLNNHYGLGGTASTGDERMQAHLPLLLHPAPRRVAFLGLGTGITAGGALHHPVEHLTAIELVPEVVDAARAHFGEENQGVLDAPLTRVVADDARNVLRAGGARYDVIIGDLVVPWRLGEGALLTQEHFQAARASLATGGLYCQWVPLFQLSRAEFEIVLRTFVSVFPRTWIWRGDFSPTAPAVALVGYATEQPTWNVLRTATPSRMRPDSSNPHLNSTEALWMHFGGLVEGPVRYAGEAGLGSGPDSRLNTENQPWVELLGPLRPGGTADVRFAGPDLEAWLSATRSDTLARANGELLPAQRAGIAAAGPFAAWVQALESGNTSAAVAARRELAALLPLETLSALGL